MPHLKEADITFKARGSEFQFVKLICLEENENCQMKVQKVVFGDFIVLEFPKKEFVDLIQKLDKCTVPFPGYSDGKSGTQYQLDIQSGENAMLFKWYGESPGDPWKDIVAFAREVLALRDRYLP